MIHRLGLSHFAQIAGVPVFFLFAAATPANPLMPGSAEWTRYALVVKLENLPKRYSCEILESKFRDVLLTLAARPENVLASQCEQFLGPNGLSPEVHLQFLLPTRVRVPESRAVTVAVVRKTIELQPGRPSARWTLQIAIC